ncbi:MAG TPA: tetratricopeptide repeat protein [Chitinophagaceae bacterium]
MASSVPTVRQVAWGSMVPQLLFMGLLIFGYYLIGMQDFFLYGAVTYLAISFGLRYFIPNDHRQGMALVNQKEFQEAIPYFKKSYDFFTKYSWVDKYRFITLLSSSKMCYREMALNNIAFCYGQTGEGDKAIEYYNCTLTEYPDNELAKAALNLLNAAKNKW